VLIPWNGEIASKGSSCGIHLRLRSIASHCLQQPKSTALGHGSPQRQTMELFLLKNCSLNTVLVDENGEARYRIQTPFKFANRATTITRAQSANYLSMSDSATLIESPGLNMTELGQIHWRCFSSSILCYNGFEMPINEYLKRNGFFCSKRTFTASDGRSYTWVPGCGQFYVSPAVPLLTKHADSLS
jgi:hypothetical protein